MMAGAGNLREHSLSAGDSGRLRFVTPEQKENGQLGIELMTAWVGSENNNDFLAARSGLFLDDQNTIPDKMAAGKAPAGVAAVASELLWRASCCSC